MADNIIKITADIDSAMPITMCVVICSLNANAPARIAVMGSNTLNTDAFVAPILRVDIANVEVETIVGKIANPNKFSQAVLPSRPVVIVLLLKIICVRKTTEPTIMV